MKSPEAHASNYLVEISKATNTLTLYKHGAKFKTYPIATGKKEDLTPEGTFHMVVKINKPGWKHIPGGAPNNPLGDKWLGIMVNGDRGREYGMHGTNQPQSIGTYASNGCVRIGKNHLHELYDLIPESTPVWIHKKPSNGTWQGDLSYQIQPLTGKGKIKTQKGTLRTGPSEGAFDVKTLNKGKEVTITGQTKDWFRIKNDKDVAYISKKEVQLDAKLSPQMQPMKFISGMVETTTDNANIRSTPLMTGLVAQRVQKGTKMVMTGESKDWFRVRLDTGYTAFLHKSVAKKTNDPLPKTNKIQIAKDRVNVRTSPSHYAPIIKNVNKGQSFQSVGVNGEWYILSLPKARSGFIHKSLVN